MNTTAKDVYRTRRSSIAILLLSACLSGVGAFSTANAEGLQEATTVRGGWVNDTACPFGQLGPTSDPTTFAIDCRGASSIFTGGFTGHTLTHITGTIDVHGNVKGSFDEWFYGRYMGDGTQGELHYQGTVNIDGGTGEFFAEARIVDGTCGFVGSKGSFAFDGNPLIGGYTAKWIRPATPVAPDATCNPVDPDSLPPFDP